MTPFLFIFESIGTQELILIGVLALIFLGPRRMPEIAKKIGKMMADFRNTTNEFKSTWEREVNFEEESEMIRSGDLPPETSTVSRENSILPTGSHNDVVVPEVKQIDGAAFEASRSKAAGDAADDITEPTESAPSAEEIAKQNWL